MLGVIHCENFCIVDAKKNEIQREGVLGVLARLWAAQGAKGKCEMAHANLGLDLLDDLLSAARHVEETAPPDSRCEGRFLVF